MTIVVVQTTAKPPRVEHEVHPEWQQWMDDSAYSHANARHELGLTNGTFYRRIAKAPTLIDRLAMRSLYEGLLPYGSESIPMR